MRKIENDRDRNDRMIQRDTPDWFDKELMRNKFTDSNTVSDSITVHIKDYDAINTILIAFTIIVIMKITYADGHVEVGNIGYRCSKKANTLTAIYYYQ